MIRIELQEVSCAIGEMETPQGKLKVMTFVDRQSGIEVTIPLMEEPAANIGAALVGSGKIVMPNGHEAAAVLAGTRNGG
jgi:hypothetical protein